MIPPNKHRANLAERAIQTFKNHFKDGLSTLHLEFSIVEGDRLLPQAFLTLNLYRPSNNIPYISAYIFGQFDFNKTSLAPPGSKVVVHSEPSNCASWNLNGKRVIYTKSAVQLYRCMTLFIPSKRKK